jgi:hypothetical protein
LEAGYRTEQVDMDGEKLVFVRPADTREAAVMKGMAERHAVCTTQGANGQHPMIGAMKGLLWIDPALDLTTPALDADEWERVLNEKYGRDERGT